MMPSPSMQRGDGAGSKPDTAFGIGPDKEEEEDGRRELATTATHEIGAAGPLEGRCSGTSFTVSGTTEIEEGPPHSSSKKKWSRKEEEEGTEDLTVPSRAALALRVDWREEREGLRSLTVTPGLCRGALP